MTEAVTLITGASSGIGKELARIFAANGHRLVLVARRDDLLKELAAEITATGAPEPMVFACDLQQPDSGDRIAAALAEAGFEPAYVVNNAGYGLYGRANQLDRQDQIGIIDVNIRAATDLSLRFIDSVIRNKGGILNVASVVAYLPGPGMAVYHASKAYLLSFTEALYQELRRHGVRVTALCPGPVVTGFQRRAGFELGFDTAILKVSPKNVARAAYRGLMANQRVVLPGLGIRAIPFLLRFAPRPLVLAAVSRVQKAR